MKIEKITINNFRSIREISLELKPDLNVFVGTNGSGKTTVLEAISLSLSWLINRIQRQNSSGNSISDSDIRIDAPFSSIEITCKENDQSYSWKLVKGAIGKPIEARSELTELSKLATHFQRILEGEEQLPVIAFYPVTRVVNKTSPEIKTKDNLSILDVYENALGVQQNFQTFFEWFRIQDDIVNEGLGSRAATIERIWDKVKKRFDHILNLLQKISLGTKQFNYLSGRINRISRIEGFVQYELQKLISDISEHLEHSNLNFENFFRPLFFFLAQMDSYGSEKRDYLIDREEAWTGISGKFFRIIGPENLETNQDRIALEIILELFILINNLSLWWISDSVRNELEKIYRDSFSRFLDKKQDREIISEEILNSLQHILSREIQQMKNAPGNEGRELATVRQAIEDFLPGYSSLRVKRLPRPHMLINKGIDEFNLNQLSDGEKNLITLVGDIARRLSIANPETKEPLKAEGIILIDELDLHLHPAWQRIMIPQLKKTFPNCQFIVSTHSPQILSHTQPDSIFLLKNEGNELSYSKASESFGKNTDRILEDLLGVDARPSEEKERLEKLYRLIEKGQLEEAEDEIHKLSEIIPGGDPELVKANVLIKRKRIIGK